MRVPVPGRRQALAPALLLLGLLIAACSGGSSPSPAATPVPVATPLPATPAPASEAPPTEAPPTETPAASEAPPATGDAVTIAGFAFSPASLTVPAGTTVTWTNADTAPHTATADDDSFDSTSLSNGESFTQTFEAAGTFAYHCAIHPRMKGTIVVQ